MHIKTIIMQRFPRLRASGLGIKLLGPIMFDIPVVTDSTLKRSCFVEITAKIILSKCYEPTLTNQTICTQWTTSNIIIIAFIFKARGSRGGSRKVAKTLGGRVQSIGTKQFRSTSNRMTQKWKNGFQNGGFGCIFVIFGIYFGHRHQNVWQFANIRTISFDGWWFSVKAINTKGQG